MSSSGFRDRFFESTRGRIVCLLRSTSRSVNDLAETLELTDNAVRAHLMSLERDGLVHPVGKERGIRKPNVTYGLTEEGEQLFPRAYSALLTTILNVLGEKIPPSEMDGLLREAGRRLAAAHALGPDENRVERATQALADLGGMAELTSESGRLTIQGSSCPLKDVVEGYPAACSIAESLIAEIIGVPVTEHCEKGKNPRCCFEIGRS